MGIGKMSRRKSLLALAVSAVGGLCCSAFGQIADPGNLYYQTPATSISSMCCYGVNQANLANTEVSSNQFANWVGNAFDPGGRRTSTMPISSSSNATAAECLALWSTQWGLFRGRAGRPRAIGNAPRPRQARSRE